MQPRAGEPERVLPVLEVDDAVAPEVDVVVDEDIPSVAAREDVVSASAVQPSVPPSSSSVSQMMARKISTNARGKAHQMM